MPARNSSMELSSPSNPDVDSSVQPSRRKSGRVSKAAPRPDYSSPQTESGATKRKHSETRDNADMDSAEEEDVDEDDGEPDEEELREKKRKAKKTKTSKGEPSRAKVNGINGALPVRPAASRVRKPKKAAGLVAANAGAVGGLYGQVYGLESDIDQVIAEWKERFNAYQSEALAEIVNLILRSSGCEIEVNSYDIEDPDNAPSKLIDIQEQFQAENLPDYPIISKKQGSASLKRTLIQFFEQLVCFLATTDLLYTEPDLIENIQVWVATMSSAAHRPFRHTATLVALSILDGLCQVGKTLITKQANVQRQREGEQKKSKPNQARIKALGEERAAEDEKRSMLEDIIKDWSDAVFVHRYRDVDPRIRIDCVTHLTNWITLYPDTFFDGQHLRYLGWLLSDPSPQTRQEVLKQLHRLYKDRANLPGLQQFTERFRPRMVEMATQDAEPSVRVSAIETIDNIRDAGLLEPDDIDTIGRLVYDAEPKVRKAVVPFFAASVQDSYDDKLLELGGMEALEEVLPGVEDEEYEAVRLDWLKLKALAELLRSFDPDESPSRDEQNQSVANDVLIASGNESRFSMAAQAFLPQIDVLQNWQILAGYLLFDGSAATSADASDPEEKLKAECSLDPKEEALLLDVLNQAVKVTVTEVVKEGKTAKPSKKEKQELEERQEATAQSLAIIIPKLLNKFGAAPAAASAVLRLQRLLNLDVFQELRQDSTLYAALLDDIQKQFMSHKTKDVVAEASNALLHARSFQSLEEITDERVRIIWGDTAYALIEHCLGEDLESRGSIEPPTLIAISSTVLRIASLARVSDCTSSLETPQTYVSAKRRRTASNIAPQIPLNLLLDLLSRGRPVSGLDADVDVIEDELVSSVISALLCYFFWQAKVLQSETPNEEGLGALMTRRESFADKLHGIVSCRRGTDHLRVNAAEALIDVHTVFTVNTNAARPALVQEALAEPLTSTYQNTLLKLFVAVERDYAKLSKKKLEDPAEDEDPEDLSDDEPDDDDETVDTHKQRELLLAEDRLCNLAGKLVLAVISGAADSGGKGDGTVRKRISRNKGRLGQNFKEVITALDRPAEKARARKSRAKPKAKIEKNVKSKEVVEEDDDEHEEMRDDEDDDADALRARGLVVEKEVSRRDAEAEGGDMESESTAGD